MNNRLNIIARRFSARPLLFGLLLAMVMVVCNGQTAPANPAVNVRYFRHLLENLVGLDLHPEAVAAERRALIRRLKLNADELAAIDRITVELKGSLRTIRATSASIVAQGPLSPAALSNLSALQTTRDQAVVLAATKVLASIRPETATALLTAQNAVTRGTLK